MSLATPPDATRGPEDFGVGRRWSPTLAAWIDGRNVPRLDVVTLIAGPMWSAGHGLWALFWPALIFETVVLTTLVRLWSATEPAGGALLLFLGLFVAGRLVQGVLAGRALGRAFERWLYADGKDGRPTARRILTGIAITALFLTCAVVSYGLPEPVTALRDFPASKPLHVATVKAIAAGKEWMVANFAAFFNAVTFTVRTTLNTLDLLFVGTPWPLMAFLILAAIWRASGLTSMLIAAAGLLYLGVFGYWDKAMSTISLVSASTLICVAIGLPIGIVCAKRPRFYALVRPVLDFMQTMPSFVYLIPAVAFFSIGKPPGVLATVVFALPVMIRLTALGIEQVPDHIAEGARAFGANRWQLLAKVELPLALPSIAAAVNQTIMMCLSMVIIAAMIGAGGLGLDIMTSLRQLNIGEGVLAGTAIVVCALIMDRLVQVKQR